ncbi:MAG: hypothetical protein IAG10_17030 [Planctomycetaceae bacterium]|nr:hypothetical protein [Planctomycetaceae bacterium]
MNHTRIERAILDEVERFQFAFPELIIGTLSDIAVDGAMSGLVRRRALHEVRLLSGHAYLSVPKRKPPTNQSVTRALGIHTFCCGDSHRRTFLQKTELTRYFPTLFQAGLPRGYYVDATGKEPVLGHLRVDVGPDDIVRIVQRCHQLARRHQQLAGFQRLIAAGQFEITYLVATEQKARRLSAALSPLAMTGVRCIAESVPVLLDLLAPLPTT